MGSILLPFRGEPTRAFAELSKDPLEQMRVARSLSETVKKSLRADALREGKMVVRATQDDIKKRMAQAIEIFGTLRNDCGYSVAHALDEVPRGLRAALDGVAWEPPPKDRMWAANS